MKLAITLILVAAACGSKSKPEPAKPEMAAMGGHEEHAKMSPEIAKFHDVLAPRWHAEKGAQRMKDTCGAMPEFQTNADALAKATAPAGAEPAKWTAGTKELTDALGALDATCKANDATAFEPAFHRVHEGFHAVMELSAGMSEHAEHHGAEAAEHKM